MLIKLNEYYYFIVFDLLKLLCIIIENNFNILKLELLINFYSIFIFLSIKNYTYSIY